MLKPIQEIKTTEVVLKKAEKKAEDYQGIKYLENGRWTEEYTVHRFIMDSKDRLISESLAIVRRYLGSEEYLLKQESIEQIVEAFNSSAIKATDAVKQGEVIDKNDYVIAAIRANNGSIPEHIANVINGSEDVPTHAPCTASHAIKTIKNAVKDMTFTVIDNLLSITVMD